MRRDLLKAGGYLGFATGWGEVYRAAKSLCDLAIILPKVTYQ